MKKVDLKDRKTQLVMVAILVVVMLLISIISNLWWRVPLRDIDSKIDPNGQIETILSEKAGKPDVVTVKVCYSKRVRGTWKNIVKSAEALDNITLEPGDDFSWLRDVGACGKEEGYVLGGGFDGMEYGGGICFTATGLFRLMYTVKEIEDDIHTKHNAHHKEVWYATDRNDATIDAEHNVDLYTWNDSSRTLKVRVKVNNWNRTITFTGTLT